MSSKNALITDNFKFVKKQPEKLKKTTSTLDGPSTSAYQAKGRQLQQHEEKLSDIDILRQFDMNLHFGPCLGITRLERWERANKHGLDPPMKVYDLIMGHPKDPNYTECVWKGYVI